MNRGDRWCRTGRAILQAVREVREEDNQRGVRRSKMDMKHTVIQKAKAEAGDLMYSCLMEAQWERPLAEAGAMMINYYNKEAQLS